MEDEFNPREYDNPVPSVEPVPAAAPSSKKLHDIAFDVATLDWGTSVPENYHNMRMERMDALRKLLIPPRTDEPVPAAEPSSKRWVNILTCNHEAETNALVADTKCPTCGTTKMVIRRVCFTRPIPDSEPVPAATPSSGVSDAPPRWNALEEKLYMALWETQQILGNSPYRDAFGLIEARLSKYADVMQKARGERGDSGSCVESANAHLIAALHAILDAAISKARGEHAKT